MKNQGNNQIKRILEEGMHELPSQDFNTRVIEQYLFEREQLILKPGINYVLLLISSAMILMLSGLILYLHTPSPDIIPFISDINNIQEHLYILLFMICTFSIFTMLSDILENRGVLIKLF